MLWLPLPVMVTVIGLPQTPLFIVHKD